MKVVGVLFLSLAGVSANHCDLFCKDIITTCGVGGEYQDEAECLVSCKAQKRSMLDGSFYGDTFECRDYHLSVAKSDENLAGVHCPHAGPTGGGVCVDGKKACENFCKTFADVTCSPFVKHDPEYATPEKCMAACGAYPQTGLVGAVSGDTYQCREYHLAVAYQLKASGGAEVHCGHARKAPVANCVPSITPCQAFCTAHSMYCGDNSTIANGNMTAYSDCEAECEEFSTSGKVGDTQGNTLQCREYHLGIAALGRGNPATRSTHCPHACADGGGVCTSESVASGAAAVGFQASMLLATSLFAALSIQAQ